MTQRHGDRRRPRARLAARSESPAAGSGSDLDNHGMSHDDGFVRLSVTDRLVTRPPGPPGPPPGAVVTRRRRRDSAQPRQDITAVTGTSVGPGTLQIQSRTTLPLTAGFNNYTCYYNNGLQLYQRLDQWDGNLLVPRRGDLHGIHNCPTNSAIDN